MSNQRGFALVITLLITALLVALTAQFIDEVYVDTSVSHNYVAAQQASILAASGVGGAVKLIQSSQRLNKLSNKPYTSLSDLWAQPLQFEEDQGKLVVSIEEESGKLNINLFPDNGNLDGDIWGEVAARLFTKLNLKDSNSLIDTLADWRSTSSTPHTYGAKSDYYSKLKPPYLAKNGRLDTIEELALLKGFAGDTFNKVRSFVTVYDSDEKKININTAPKEIIEALDKDITPEKSTQIIAKRPFSNAAGLGEALGSQAAATGLLNKVNFKGNIYRIRSQAFVKDTSRVVEAVVRVTDGLSDGKYLYWREY